MSFKIFIKVFKRLFFKCIIEVKLNILEIICKFKFFEFLFLRRVL